MALFSYNEGCNNWRELHYGQNTMIGPDVNVGNGCKIQTMLAYIRVLL